MQCLLQALQPGTNLKCSGNDDSVTGRSMVTGVIQDIAFIARQQC